MSRCKAVMFGIQCNKGEFHWHHSVQSCDEYHKFEPKDVAQPGAGVGQLSNHRLLHTLWTKAVGTKDYNKEEWLQLESRLIKLTKYEAAEEDQKTILSTREDKTSQKNI